MNLAETSLEPDADGDEADGENEARGRHQARSQLPPDADHQPATGHDLSPRKVLRNRILGGLINEYRYAA
jgi:hypothetical protein